MEEKYDMGQITYSKIILPVHIHLTGQKEKNYRDGLLCSKMKEGLDSSKLLSFERLYVCKYHLKEQAAGSIHYKFSFHHEFEEEYTLKLKETIF